MIRAFRPTYLYIKRHNLTGKLYFGKTTLDYEEMLAYLGSGTLWNKHINKHGIEYVETIWFCLFYDKEDCRKFAENFSDQEKIVESKIWANLRPENGIDGGSAKGTGIGRKQSKETCNKRAKSLLGNTNGRIGNTKNHPPITEENRARLVEIRTGSKQSAETIAKKSRSQTGQIRSEESKKNMRKPKYSNINYFGAKERCICPHCGKEGGVNIMPRYHFDNCKHKVTLNKEYISWPLPV